MLNRASLPLRLDAVGYVVGTFLLMMGAVMLVPLAFTFGGGSDSPAPMLSGLVPALVCGLLMVRFLKRPQAELSVREALLTVMAVWASVAFFGSLPFYFSPYFANFTDAFFESASGFTTTGATILVDVEVLPASLQFWRHFAHWLGGMGIVMLGIAILPLVGAGGRTLYNAQFAGPQSEKLKPRVLQTAHALWAVYLAITVAEFTALRLAGMNSFDAICHTFSTLGTGGFSTRTASIAYYDNFAIEIVLGFFMIVSSLNFAVQYKAWNERSLKIVARDPEVRFHVSVLALSILTIALSLVWALAYSPAVALREAFFQAVSIGTTTGFATADFELWPPFAQMTLLALMYFGGNTGSTAGGFKTFRMVVLLRIVGRTMSTAIAPRRVMPVRVGGTVLPDSTLAALLNLVILALLFNFLGSLLLAASGVDLLTSFSAVPASMFSVGPGLGTVGPAENYAHLPAFAKWVLAVTMLVGRVEFYTALVIFTPHFWRS